MNQENLILMSVDNRSAFDLVNHDFMLKVLGKFGFPPYFMQWISCIYQPYHLESMVLVNGFLSIPFFINRGIRQGCPLSPLLYALTVEPLSIHIDERLDLRGIAFAGFIFKKLKYCDDTNLFL